MIRYLLIMVSREAGRRASAAVFGNRYRAELLAALVAAGESGVCLTELATAQRAPASVYHAPMQALVRAGLAERTAPTAGERRRWYRLRGEAAVWRSLGQFLEGLDKAVSPARVG
jgi:hypothetical protein